MTRNMRPTSKVDTNVNLLAVLTPTKCPSVSKTRV